MPVNLTIKNVPDALYEALRRSADASRRSMNNEVIVILEKGVRQRLSTEETLARIRALRDSLPTVKLTDREINKAKRQGRP